ncbi:helix-turn-helix transcriptional regulator [Nonomuraea aurantiaca]|uniref:helix-turn-helix transcriptional regulator n=1 Tax=Nonomuraea aurantiaca TaxID=2878562 RepID=UPI001CD9A362|nr:helix-turn-helix transcriptional regulator [Nonomuraea aurantiaca]MCA2227584.1 helix-turn-helix transcriptional regulator [Nonomuraea aurantiaca]
MKPRQRHEQRACRWSQADLADRCQVSRQAINAIETERYDPSLPLAFTIADVFDLTIEEIFLPDRGDTTNDPARS